MTSEELKSMANLQEQVNRIEGVVRKLIDKIAQLETANAVDNFLNSIKADDIINNSDQKPLKKNMK